MHPGESQTKARLQGVVEKRSAQPNRSPAAASMWPKGLDPEDPVTEVLTLALLGQTGHSVLGGVKRFDILGDQRTSDRHFRHRPIFRVKINQMNRKSDSLRLVEDMPHKNQESVADFRKTPVDAFVNTKSR
jgi:hypothetical protein